METQIFRLRPYHAKDNGHLVEVGRGHHTKWELEYIERFVFENFVVWKCKTCKKLLNSDDSVEHSYRYVDVDADMSNNSEPPQ